MILGTAPPNKERALKVHNNKNFFVSDFYFIFIFYSSFYSNINVFARIKKDTTILLKLRISGMIFSLQ